LIPESPKYIKTFTIGSKKLCIGIRLLVLAGTEPVLDLVAFSVYCSNESSPFFVSLHLLFEVNPKFLVEPGIILLSICDGKCCPQTDEVCEKVAIHLVGI